MDSKLSRETFEKWVNAEGISQPFFAVAKNLPEVCITPLSEVSANDVL